MLKKEMLVALIILLWGNYLQAQTAMINVQSRTLTSLNGDWQVVLANPNNGLDLKTKCADSQNVKVSIESFGQSCNYFRRI